MRSRPQVTRTTQARYVRAPVFFVALPLLFILVQERTFADGYGAIPGVNSGKSEPTENASSASRGWAAMSGTTLKDTLEAWAMADGWTVVWDTETNYGLRASSTFNGTFVDAVKEIVDSIHVSNPELTVTVYTGNRVVHVQTLLNETR